MSVPDNLLQKEVGGSVMYGYADLSNSSIGPFKP